jgi:Lrp/AsnC family transcriptional regulator for asnA, asnC and gidA
VTAETTAERILAALEEDAQASYEEISERAGVSKPTVRKYINRLEDEGVIVGYTAEVDPKKVSGQSIAMVGVEAESDRYVEVCQALKEMGAVRALYASSGDHMLLAEIRAADGDELGELIQEEVLAVNGVTAAHPTFLQERLK